MIISSAHLRSISLLALAALIVPMDAIAQRSGTEQRMLEEIVVTATKREANVQDVPITITAINGGDLVKLGIESLDELPIVAPGMHTGRVNGSTVVMLRGVGTNNAGPSNEASVATYIDGVYYSNTTVHPGNLADIDRIEVLKGPQGTLFGRNATGGLIHVITKVPSHEPEFKVKVGYGNFDTFEGSFYGTTGITDHLAANFSVTYKDAGDSYLDQAAPAFGDYLPERSLVVRSKLLYTPTEDLEIKLTGYGHDSESALGTARTPLPGVRNQGGQAHTGDYWDIASDTPSYGKYFSLGADAQIRYSFAAADLVSITSWAKGKNRNTFDNDAGATLLQNSFGHIPVDTYTQELRLVSTTDTRLDWIVGLYYYYNTSKYSPLYVQLSAPPLLANYASQKTTSWAGFGEITYALNDSTNLTIGLRTTKDKQEFEGQTFRGANPIFPFTKMDDSFRKSTWRFGLDHHITDNSLVYATYSRGYKTGLFNVVSLSPAGPQPAVEPEILDAYEIGFKTDGWFDGRLRVNGAAYYYDYDDLQVVTIGVASQATANATATIYGWEMDMRSQLSDRLTLAASYAYTHAEFDEYFGRTNRPAANGLGNTPVVADFADNQIYRTPDWTFSALLNYAVPTSSGEFNFSVNFYHNDGYFWDEDNRIEEPSYSLVNGEVSWTNPEDTITVSLWGRNLTDKKYSIYTNNSPSSGDAYVPAEPRMYGVSASYHYR